MDRINHAFIYMKNTVSEFFSEEKAQDTLEYILIIGAVSVAVIVALLAFTPGELVEAMCGAIAAIDTNGAAAGGTPFAGLGCAA
jgi:hypothetical protein